MKEETGKKKSRATLGKKKYQVHSSVLVGPALLVHCSRHKKTKIQREQIQKHDKCRVRTKSVLLCYGCADSLSTLEHFLLGFPVSVHLRRSRDGLPEREKERERENGRERAHPMKQCVSDWVV